MERPRAHLHVVGLQDHTSLLRPVALEGEDQILEGADSRWLIVRWKHAGSRSFWQEFEIIAETVGRLRSLAATIATRSWRQRKRITLAASRRLRRLIVNSRTQSPALVVREAEGSEGLADP